jgi:Tol biopolymer transport system component
MRAVLTAFFLALAAVACSGGENEGGPRTTSDGSKIAFVRSHTDIYVMNADGSGQTKLTEGDGGLIWLAHGSKIAFTRFLGTGEVQIFVMNADGSGQAGVGKNVSNRGNAGLALSPDGSKIAFARWGGGDVWYRKVFEIYVANADGSGETRLYRTRGNIDAPTSTEWSPDGSKIAFVSSRDRSWAGKLEDIRAGYAVTEIYVANADGSGVTRLTNNRKADYHPVWSPDGSKIAFISERDIEREPPRGPVVSEVYVMDADGTGETRLTDIGTVAGDPGPSWSPDGSMIAFISYLASGVYVMNADGSAVRRVTHRETGSLSWSPDSSKIAFGDDGIFVVNADGSGLTRLTRMSDGAPVWSPAVNAG